MELRNTSFHLVLSYFQVCSSSSDPNMNMNLPSGRTLLLLRCKERGEEREREKGGSEKVAVIDFMFDERVSLSE